MKVYVITKGEYSDYHICAVATDKEMAEQLKKKFSTNYEQADIEEYDTDNFQEILRFKNAYVCHLHQNDNYISVSQTSFDYAKWNVGKWREGLYVCVNADNEQDALKFASDKFAKYKAERMGL